MVRAPDVVIDAILGAREIFSRMRSYAIYSVTSTIRIVLTFSILAMAFDLYFPTLIVVFIALLNDGTILTISKDRAKQPRAQP